MSRGFGGGGKGGGGFGGGGMGGMQNLMKQASEMQKKLAQAQVEAEKKVHELEAAGGSIKLKINGKFQLESLLIDDSLMTDKETLQDALLVGLNEALAKVTDENNKATEKLGGGMKIPGLF